MGRTTLVGALLALSVGTEALLDVASAEGSGPASVGAPAPPGALGAGPTPSCHRGAMPSGWAGSEVALVVAGPGVTPLADVVTSHQATALRVTAATEVASPTLQRATERRRAPVSAPTIPRLLTLPGLLG